MARQVQARLVHRLAPRGVHVEEVEDLIGPEREHDDNDESGDDGQGASAIQLSGFLHLLNGVIRHSSDAAHVLGVGQHLKASPNKRSDSASRRVLRV